MNPSKPVTVKFEKKCSKCQVVLPITDFSLNRSKIDGRASYCKPCHNKTVKAYYLTPVGKEARKISKQARRVTQKAAVASAKLRYEQAVAQLSPEDRARLGR